MVLGKLPVPGHPVGLDSGVGEGARAYCICLGCGWGLFGLFCSCLSFLFFLPHWETARYRLKYCLKGPLDPK